MPGNLNVERWIFRSMNKQGLASCSLCFVTDVVLGSLALPPIGVSLCCDPLAATVAAIVTIPTCQPSKGGAMKSMDINGPTTWGTRPVSQTDWGWFITV